MVVGSEDVDDVVLLNSGARNTDLSISTTSRKKQSTAVFVGLTLFATTFLVYTTYLIVSDFLFGGYVWYDVDKPNNDPRIYKFLPELIENAPPIVVVQDPGAQLTGFAIGVSAGAFNDPPDFAGLAHFTEHMLFLGTEKYPGPVAFDEYISSHGGSSNAFTDSERTVYYNSIDTDAFAGGFSRFLEFFMNPSFNKTYMEKEVKAVDSEHDMHINDPNWRLFSVISSMSLPPYNHYSTGDSSTLLGAGIDKLDAAVRNYFASNYCLNRISIAVVSPLPVSDQIEIVRDVFASSTDGSSRQAVNCRPAVDFSVRRRTQLPFESKQLGKLVYSEAPDATQPVLWIAFPFRAVSTMASDAGKHPFGILESILVYNGEKSLKQFLISEGLITSMSLVADDTSAGSIMYLAFDLPLSSRDRVDEIVSAVFAFIDGKMKQEGGMRSKFIEQLQQLRSSLFYSNAEMNSIVNEGPMRLSKYFASQLTTLARNRTAALHNEKFGADLISVNEKILQVDSALVDELINTMTLSNSIVLFHDPKYSNQSPPAWVSVMTNQSNAVVEVEDPHYAFKYSVRDLNLSSLPSSGQRDISKLEVFKSISVMPPLIEKSTETATRTNMTEVMNPPVNIFSSNQVEIWYKKSCFAGPSLPKVWLWGSVKPEASAFASASPEEIQLNGEMLVDCVTFQLRSRVADYILAGYSFNINWMMAGYIEVRVSGWEDRIEELLGIVVGEISNPSLAYFDLILDEKIDSMNRARSMSDIAGEALNSLVVGSPTREDIKTYINTYSPNRDGLLKWSKNAFTTQPFFTLYIGAGSSVTQDQVKSLGTAFVERFNATTGSSDGPIQFVAGPKIAKPVEVRMLNPASDSDPNSVLLYSLTYGTDMTPRDRIIAALLASIVDPLIFRNIRTHEQLGYIASGKIGVYPGPAGAVQFRVYIQGNVVDPDVMEARLEALLATIPTVLQGIASSEISERAQGVAAGLEEQPTSANIEVSMFWQPIHDQSNCFRRGLNQADFLKSADPNALRTSLVSVFNSFWTERRRKVAVKVFRSEGANGEVAKWDKNALSKQLGLDSAEVVSNLETERAQTVTVNGISKSNRETVFKSALDTTDPLWDPVVPSCDI